MTSALLAIAPWDEKETVGIGVSVTITITVPNNWASFLPLLSEWKWSFSPAFPFKSERPIDPNLWKRIQTSLPTTTTGGRDVWKSGRGESDEYKMVPHELHPFPQMRDSTYWNFIALHKSIRTGGEDKKWDSEISCLSLSPQLSIRLNSDQRRWNSQEFISSSFPSQLFFWRGV